MIQTVTLSEKYFRPQTEFKKTIYNLFLTNGGLGDYLNFIPALRWIEKECPQVIAYIFVREPFLSVIRYLFQNNKEWKFFDPKDAEQKIVEGSFIHRLDPKKQYINATGCHLMDLGFMQFCQVDKPYPGYDMLPEIDYQGPWRWPELTNVPYACFTPGATAKARQMPAYAFNELVRYTKEKGITPVFLGKRLFSEQSADGYKADISQDYDLTQGVDLTERTSLLEATQIMGHAKFVLGIDNGLLHFAGATKVPIIFGHTVTTIEHRRIRRKEGLTIDITLDRESMPCIGCQSKMRYIPGHKFSKCLYDDYACLSMIFHSNCGTWKKAIDHIVLAEHSKINNLTDKT